VKNVRLSFHLRDHRLKLHDPCVSLGLGTVNPLPHDRLTSTGEALRRCLGHGYSSHGAQEERHHSDPAHGR